MARILVIDDDPDIRGFVHQILEFHGHRLTQADKGRRGTALRKGQAFDLLITDLIMPDTEGLETIRELRAAYPGQKIPGHFRHRRR